MFCVLIGVVDVDFLGWVVKELGNDEAAKTGTSQTITVCNPVEFFCVFIRNLNPDEFVGLIVWWVWRVHTEILKGW